MTISHVIYLEFARLIVSWQWVTEVPSSASGPSPLEANPAALHRTAFRTSKKQCLDGNSNTGCKPFVMHKTILSG